MENLDRIIHKGDDNSQKTFGIRRLGNRWTIWKETSLVCFWGFLMYSLVHLRKCFAGSIEKRLLLPADPISRRSSLFPSHALEFSNLCALYTHIRLEKGSNVISCWLKYETLSFPTFRLLPEIRWRGTRIKKVWNLLAKKVRKLLSSFCIKKVKSKQPIIWLNKLNHSFFSLKRS